jgi:hypothetical protein
LRFLSQQGDNLHLLTPMPPERMRLTIMEWTTLNLIESSPLPAS